MKTLKYLLLVCLVLLLPSCKPDEPALEGDFKTVVNAYGYKVDEINNNLETFIQKAQAYESANFYELSIPEIRKIFDEYINSGEKLVKSFNDINKIKLTSYYYYQAEPDFPNPFRTPEADIPCSKYDFIPPLLTGSVSPGLAKTIGDLIGDTKADRALIEERYKKGEIDDNEYYDLVEGLRKEKLSKTANYTFGALMGTGAATFTGLAVGVVTLPAIATVTAVGVGVGTAVTWLANKYTGSSKGGKAPPMYAPGNTSANTYYMATGKTTTGGNIPIQLIPEGSDLTIHVKGQAPVYIKDFKLPKAGTSREIDIHSVKTNAVNKGDQAEVCYFDTPLTATSCNDILFVNAYASPANPSPGQSVSVVATVIPAIKGCDIHFHIIGTDGYEDSETIKTDANGQASFGIPGAEKGVFDKVSIKTSNGKSYTVTYTF